MISPQCFEKQWVFKKASEIGCRNPVMLEKSIIALNLLSLLAHTSRETCDQTVAGTGERIAAPGRAAVAMKALRLQERFFKEDCRAQT